MKLIVIMAWTLLPLLTFAQTTDLRMDSTHLTIEFKYEKIFANNPQIPKAPLTRLLTYFDKNLDSIPNRRYITFVDFSRSNHEPRMTIIDMRDGQPYKYFVTHGIGSDPGQTGRAHIFSNRINSYMSSLGLYLTGDVIAPERHPHHPGAIVVKGLEQSNDNAEERGVLLEPGDPMGYSRGCFVVQESYIQHIDNELAGGSLLMAWIDPSLIH
jgi:hypothetical protein